MAPSWLQPFIKRRSDTSYTKSRAAAAAAQHHNSRQNPASLYKLPPELVFAICLYLSLPEIVTLMLACGRFWNSRNEPDLFWSAWKLMQLRPASPDLAYARFYVLRMLEYDGLLARDHPAKYCCWECMKTHEKNAFPSKQFRTKPNFKFHLIEGYTYYRPQRALRYCSLSRRHIWYGIRGELSFSELKYTVLNPETVGDVVPIPSRSFLRISTHFDRRRMTLDHSIPLCKVNDFDVIGLCQSANFPLCPHLRLGNEHVAPLCRSLDQVAKCAKCPTRYWFTIHQRFIRICVIRYVGSLFSPTDPIWMAQSYTSRNSGLDPHCLLFSDWYVKTYLSRSAEWNKNRRLKEFKYPMSRSADQVFKDVHSLQA